MSSPILSHIVGKVLAGLIILTVTPIVYVIQWWDSKYGYEE